MMSIKEQLLLKIRHRKKAVPFFLNEFSDLGSKQALQKAMGSLVTEGIVVRLDVGIYSRPKLLRYTTTMSFLGSAESVAKLWAKKHGHKIVLQGFEDAYRLGMQTQAPMKKIFWSSGYSRSFTIENETVQLIKKTNRDVLLFSASSAGSIYRALIALKHVTKSQFLTAFRRLKLSDEQIQNVISKLLKQRSLSKQAKLILMSMI